MAATLIQESQSYDTDAVFLSNVVSGRVILVAQYTNEYAGEPGAPTISAGTATIVGGSFTKIEGAAHAGVGGISLYYGIVDSGGSMTITGADYSYHISEWAGLDTADLVEDSAIGTSSGTTVTTTALATAATTLVIGYIAEWGWGSPSVTQPSGFTAYGTAGAWLVGGYDEDVAAGTPTPVWTLGTSQDVSWITVALNLAAGGVGGPVASILQQHGIGV